MHHEEVYSICATKKLLDRAKAPINDPVEPTTVLGNWYATAVFLRPQVALFVNEETFPPVPLPLAPAREIADRFPAALSEVLWALGVDDALASHEVNQMFECAFAKTANRSVLGVMNEFVFEAQHFYEGDLFELSTRCAGTPLGPLRNRHRSQRGVAPPARETRRESG